MSENLDRHSHEHTHIDADGRVYTHTHGAGDTHPHTHSHTQTKAVVNRLSRAIGHLESVKRMVEDGRDCTEVLMQLAAVRSALNNTAKVILKDHIEHCLTDAVETGDQQSIEDLNAAIEKFMSGSTKRRVWPQWNKQRSIEARARRRLRSARCWTRLARRRRRSPARSSQ